MSKFINYFANLGDEDDNYWVMETDYKTYSLGMFAKIFTWKNLYLEKSRFPVQINFV